MHERADTNASRRIAIKLDQRNRGAVLRTARRIQSIVENALRLPTKTTWEQLLNHIGRTPSTTRIDISNHPKITCTCLKTQLTPQPSVADTRRQRGRGNIQFKWSASNLPGGHTLRTHAPGKRKLVRPPPRK